MPHAGSAGLHRFTIAIRPPCPVGVGRGALADLRDLIQRSHRSPLALVTDEVVGPLHAGKIAGAVRAEGKRLHVITVPAGERHKTRATKERIEDALAEARMPRHGLLIALGGGVVTDLAGFAAATWMRGIPWIAVPTTLLGMVDASLGGKTGVDLPSGKNLVGAFHHPIGIFADTALLDTLPPEAMRQGIAECVKAAVIGDADLFGILEQGAGAIARREQDLIDTLIARAAAVKARIVAADEREANLRAVLNFGHTIGHALESVSDWSIPHGDAVSIGMVVEARLAVEAGVLGEEAALRIESALGRLALPVRPPADLPGIGADAILEATRGDKKSRGGGIPFVLPAEIGRMARGDEGHVVMRDEASVRSTIARLLGDPSPQGPRSGG